MMKVTNLCFGFDNGKFLLRDIDFQLKKGEIVGLMGPSGCGKTTFCHCICGIIPKLYQGSISGEILIDEKDITSLELVDIAQMIGVVFQDPDIQLFSDHIEEDIAFGPENLCFQWDQIHSRIKEATNAIGISNLLQIASKNLSGGQRQLAAIASVLAMNPSVLIFDESLCQLDEQGVKLVLQSISNLRNQGKSIIMVDHEIENLSLADRILVLEQGGWSC